LGKFPARVTQRITSHLITIFISLIIKLHRIHYTTLNHHHHQNNNPHPPKNDQSTPTNPLLPLPISSLTTTTTINNHRPPIPPPQTPHQTRLPLLPPLPHPLVRQRPIVCLPP